MIELSSEKLDFIQDVFYAFEKGMSVAVKKAANETAKGVRAEAVKKAADIYITKERPIRDTVTVKNATDNNLLAVVRSRGHLTPLSKFETRPKRPPKKRPKNPLYARVKRGAGGGTIGNAFVASVETGHIGVGHIGVFHRKGKDRLPIEQLYSSSAVQMLENFDVKKHIEARAQIIFEKRIEAELGRMLKAQGGGK